MKCPGSPKMVLLVTSTQATIVEISAQLDFTQFNLLIVASEKDAAQKIRLGWADVLIFEPADCGAGILCQFLAENKNLLPLILITGAEGAYPDNPSLQVNEILHRPVSGLELSTRLNAVVHLQQLERQAQSRVSASARPRVLVVEDSPLQRRVIARYLTDQNLDVLTAADGVEAMEKVRQTPPDLVLLDLILPGRDGFEVCRLLKEEASTAGTPVVIITSHSGREERIRGLECGADDFLVKPVDRKELLVRTKSLLRRKQLMDTLRSEASRDPLTGLYNRRRLAVEMQRELARAKRYNLRLAVIMLDMDDFKHYNDTNGHPAGDEVLKQLADLLTAHTREADTVCRYGGEEFIVLMSQTGLEGGLAGAENIRRQVADHLFTGGVNQPGGHLTISLGVAVFPDHGENADDLLCAVDQALYRAKRTGKNRVVAAD